MSPPAVVVRPFAPSSVLVVPLMVIVAIAVCVGVGVGVVADGVRHREVGRRAPVGIDAGLVLGLLERPE